MAINNIKQLDLIGSSACNLQCSYCYLTKNQAFNNQDKIIQNAWKNKEYLNTIKKVFKKIDSDPNILESLQLWGGEPTIHMSLLLPSAKELGEFFPNITHFLIPTNWYLIPIKDLIDFIYLLDEGMSINRTSDKKLNFHIQASIDGPPGDFNTKGHNVSWEQYKKNFDDFCEIISKKEPLKHTNIVFAICPTASQETFLSNLINYQQIHDFKTHVKKVIEYVENKIKQVNNNTLIFNAYSMIPRIAISQATSLSEAVELEKIIRMIDYENYLQNIPEPEDTEIQLFHDTRGEVTYFTRNHECPESNESAITLMPDGTIVECPCTFSQNVPEYKQELLNDKNYWEYKSCLIRESNFHNPLKEDKELIDYSNWYIYGGGYLETHSAYISLNLSMAYEMALSHQIDYKYMLNPQLLMDHYLASFMTAECYREHVNVTHNHFLTDHNMFRRWFNGYTEYAYNNHKERMKTTCNNYLKKEKI